MPKINVYLPDDLAAAVREAGIPVSPVCQRALAEAVRSVGAARKAIQAMRDPAFDAARFPRISTRVGGRMTLRLREAIRLARETCGPRQRLGTGPLLIGMLDEGHNLGVRLLAALDIDPEDVRAAARRAENEDESSGTTALGDAGGENGQSPEPDDPASLLAGMTVQARRALASALEASIELGHNYLGCEHLLLGLLAEEDSAAGRVLRDFGVDAANVRRAAAGAVAGFAHAADSFAAASSASAAGPSLEAVIRRLEAVERRLGEVAP